MGKYLNKVNEMKENFNEVLFEAKKVWGEKLLIEDIQDFGLKVGIHIGEDDEETHVHFPDQGYFAFVGEPADKQEGSFADLTCLDFAVAAGIIDTLLEALAEVESQENVRAE